MGWLKQVNVDAESDDADLVKRAQRGDASAFQRLLEKHYELMYRVAYRFTGSQENAADMTQEICLKLADRLSSFRGQSKFSTWLYQLTINACRDFFRKQGTRQQLENTYMEVQSQQNDAAHEAQVRELYRTIDQLEPTLKETALLVLTESLTHAEVLRAGFLGRTQEKTRAARPLY